jgi:hypothetical protein
VALFALQKQIFDHNSQETPEDGYTRAREEYQRDNTPQAQAQMNKYGQNYDASNAFDQTIMNAYDPRTGTWIPNSGIAQLGGGDRVQRSKQYF